jgi:hypothetical protein
MGLWIGLGLGGGAVIALTVVLIVILTSNSSTSSSPSVTPNKLVGEWQREGTKGGTLRILHFTKDGLFQERMPDDKLMTFGTYQVRGNGAAIRVGERSRIGINGQDIRELEAELLNDNELQLKYLNVVDKYRKIK